MNRELSSHLLKLPSIIGHRGACGHAPENTIASFKAAGDMGVTCVEIDVKISKKSELLIIHDDTLDRTTTGEGAVESKVYDEIKLLDAGSWFSAEFSDATVPSLMETLEFLGDHNMTCNLEIKPSPGLEIKTAQAICDFFNNGWPINLPLPLFSSFSDTCLEIALQETPHIDRALLLVDFDTNWQARAEKVTACSVHICHKRLEYDAARSIIDAGYSLRCYTVNDNETAKRLFEWGIESVFTDYPDRITDN